MSSNKIVSKQRRRLPQHPSCRFPLALATCIFEIRDGCSFPSPPWAGAMRPRLPQDFRRKPETQNKTESPDVDLEKEQKSHAGKQKSNTYKTSSRPTTNANKVQKQPKLMDLRQCATCKLVRPISQRASCRQHVPQTELALGVLNYFEVIDFVCRRMSVAGMACLL